MEENILFGQEARNKVLEGVKILNDAVSPTIGPKGRCILLENENGMPSLTKDGVSVARKVVLKDKFKRLGCEIVKEAAEKTCNIVGDATSTTILLSFNILNNGIKLLNSGFSAVEIKKGIDLAVEQVVANLKKISKPIEKEDEIKQIATISANNDKEIGSLLFDAISYAGKDGIVLIDKSNSYKNSLDIVEGMEIDRGFLSPYFITNNNKQTCELEDAYVFISTKKLKSHEELLPFLEKIHKTQKPILFIGEEIDGSFLHTVITNKLRGVFKSCAILSPGIGEYKYHFLEDIATLTGGELITDASGHDIKKLELKSLGRCKKIIINKYSTTLIGGRGNSETIEKRIESIRTQLIDPTLIDQERQILQSRLAKLCGKISIVRVGGNTEVEISEKYDRVEDALYACKAATQEGIVPGGGVALLRAGEMIKIDRNLSRDVQSGMEIVKMSCSSLLRKIVDNIGEVSADVAINKVLSMCQNEGLDGLSGEYCDLLSRGIIDPVLATRSALENAASVSGLLLLVDASIVIDDTNEDKQDNSPANPYASATAF